MSFHVFEDGYCCGKIFVFVFNSNNGGEKLAKPIYDMQNIQLVNLKCAEISLFHFMSIDFWHRHKAVDLLMKALPLHASWHLVALFLTNMPWNIILATILTLRATQFSYFRQNSWIWIRYQFNVYFVHRSTTKMCTSYHARIFVVWVMLNSEQFPFWALFK